jgi:DNA-binding XRE family transcriptional regulator
MNTKLNLALEHYMQENNVTIKDFAKSLGISKSSMHTYLNGTTTPNVITAIGIAKKLKTSVEELWG